MKQNRTISEITTQQVLDNVAKVTANPDAWPEFANFSGGTTQISDEGSGTVTLTWNPFTLVSEALALNGKRNVLEKWDRQPVTNPARLRAMWAAYFYTVYGRAPTISLGGASYYSGKAQLDEIFGTDFKDVVPAPGWFTEVRGKHAPEKFHCSCPVGKNCDTYIAVTSDGERSLQALTYAIQFIATKAEDAKTGFPLGIKPNPDSPLKAEFKDGEPTARFREEFFSLPGPVFIPQ